MWNTEKEIMGWTGGIHLMFLPKSAGEFPTTSTLGLSGRHPRAMSSPLLALWHSGTTTREGRVDGQRARDGQRWPETDSVPECIASPHRIIPIPGSFSLLPPTVTAFTTLLHLHRLAGFGGSSSRPMSAVSLKLEA